MHVLVIGGNRFVGWLLGWRLLAAGHAPTLLDRGRLADPSGERPPTAVAARAALGVPASLDREQLRRFVVLLASARC